MPFRPLSRRTKAKKLVDLQAKLQVKILDCQLTAKQEQLEEIDVVDSEIALRFR